MRCVLLTLSTSIKQQPVSRSTRRGDQPLSSLFLHFYDPSRDRCFSFIFEGSRKKPTFLSLNLQNKTKSTEKDHCRRKQIASSARHFTLPFCSNASGTVLLGVSKKYGQGYSFLRLLLRDTTTTSVDVQCLHIQLSLGKEMADLCSDVGL